VQCEQCAKEGDTTVCTKCAEGFRLHKGVCQECDNKGLCAECSTSEPFGCLKCKPGSRLENGQCLLCTDSVDHCKECSEKNKCDVCDYQVAALDPLTGKCSTCRVDNNWLKNPTTGMC
jgi:hypothetical protein